MTTLEDVSLLPDWFRSDYGRPDASGRSAAPAILVVVDKSHLQPGLLDAYWFLWTSGQIGPFIEALGDKCADETRDRTDARSMHSHVSDWGARTQCDAQLTAQSTSPYVSSTASLHRSS